MAEAELQTEAEAHLVDYESTTGRVVARRVDDTYLDLRARAILADHGKEHGYSEEEYVAALDQAHAETLALAQGRRTR